ncbi:uncharacterized protein LOC126849551 [Cataglyphis hispanica]|uniref:uncharacterized protein LOC126849551 n=1 Tax=Cataglyphis hispanica TaxID=1086592 RepID=UPI00217F3185|nr:uncharacterized protein LOC126849551 [Cataglyphis hispanica]
MERETDESDLLDSVRNVATTDAYLAWVRRCDERLESLREGCREECREERRERSTGTINSLIARVVRLTGARDDLRRRFERSGGGGGQEGFSWSEIETAFARRVLTGAVINLDYIEPLRFLEDARDTVLDRVCDVMNKYDSAKVNIAFNGEFVSGDKIAVKTIVAKNHPLLPVSNLREWYEKRVVDVILASLEEFQERDSGWALSRILNLTVNVNRYNSMRAGCYVEIPREIKLKRAVINVQSTDNACFAWSVVAALYPVEKHAERSSRYPHYTTILNLEDVEFPMNLNGIARFERLNDISINVYTIRDKKDKKRDKKNKKRDIVLLRLTDRKRERHVNLFCLNDAKRQDNATHFAWIKNLSRLVGSQLSARRHKAYICDRCMHYFRTSDKLSAHSERMNECAILLPTEEDKWLNFDNYERKERVPFVVYADLECALERKEERRTPKTSIIQHHKAHSVGYYARCAFDDARSMYRSHRGDDCVSWFVRELRDLALRARDFLNTIAPMTPLTANEQERFLSATSCHVCERPFESEDVRVRDHCHSTGRASLEKLASYLDKSELKIARSEFSDLDDADFELLTRKGVFPYEYVDDIDKLRETRLPPREAFRSSLTGDTVSGSDYERAIKVWERFRVRTLGEYSDLYLKTDVLLLADIFENFCDACMKSYGLDPAHYYTLPGYTWDAMLKYMGVRFELLTDIDMVMFVERGIRGGLSQCFNRYVRANNKYLKSYNLSEPSSYLMYFDVNNLYGWAICQSLPYEDFQWVEDVLSIDLMSVMPNSPTGYIIEVDLAYPSNLHDSHAVLPEAR